MKSNHKKTLLSCGQYFTLHYPVITSYHLVFKALSGCNKTALNLTYNSLLEPHRQLIDTSPHLLLPLCKAWLEHLSDVVNSAPRYKSVVEGWEDKKQELEKQVAEMVQDDRYWYEDGKGNKVLADEVRELQAEIRKLEGNIKGNQVGGLGTKASITLKLINQFNQEYFGVDTFEASEQTQMKLWVSDVATFNNMTTDEVDQLDYKSFILLNNKMAARKALEEANELDRQDEIKKNESKQR